MTDDSYEERTDGPTLRHCTDCDILIDALRDMEQQCREAEDERFRDLSVFSTKSFDRLNFEEDEYQEKLNRLQHRRDCALEVLLKHQSLEHL